VGPGLVTQESVTCNSCKGAGKLFKERDRCRKCKGDRVIEKTNFLEIYIPRGSKYVITPPPLQFESNLEKARRSYSFER
jgi:DnaJ-class molecular chaperone